MSETTANLALPYILPSQAQKHVTHNEALQFLDAVVQLVIAGDLTSPPASPAEGACFWVIAPASAGWSGREGQIAIRQDGDWLFMVPKDGWRALSAADGRLKIFSAGAWTDSPLPDAASFSALGINTGTDSYNRLALSADASLFTHAGGGHQMKINKASGGDTASLLFQTAWQGRAEMGTAGGDDFSIKVSPDGAAWTTALTVSADGRVRMPARPVVRAALGAATLSPASGNQSGFDDLHVQQGGFSLGAALSPGYGQRLTVPASGIYWLALNVSVVSSTGHGIELRRNGTTPLAAITGRNASGSAALQSTTVVSWLDEGDWLCLQHSGDPQMQFGYCQTELIAAML